MTTRGRQTSNKSLKGNSIFPFDRSCCCVSSRIHSHFPTLERDGATVMKVGEIIPLRQTSNLKPYSGFVTALCLQMDTLGTASSPWIRGDNHRVPAEYFGPREPGYSRRSRLLPGTTTQPHLCSSIPAFRCCQGCFYCFTFFRDS